MEKKCPQCAEMIKDEAKICRFCQFEFNNYKKSNLKADIKHVRAHSGVGDGIKLAVGNTIFKILLKIGIWGAVILIIIVIASSE